MRIVQIIDSLEVGGAEKMAINYANSLAKRIDFSGLIATRKEGHLKSQMDSGVNYLFLNKKKTIDLKAIFRLKDYCRNNKIEIIQPHSSSYFIAVLLKLIYPKIQIIWHDHNGLSAFLGSQKWIPLKIASLFFKGIIVVNDQLLNWAKGELYCENVIYLPNFTKSDEIIQRETTLKGEKGKRIVCLANLRDQKNHFLLLEVAKKLKNEYPDWSFHLVGKDFQDDYSNQVKESIRKDNLENNVYLYDTRNDITHIISQTEIAILTSKSEGLPVALLEYGLSKKPVVVTNVGEIPLIIKDSVNGFIVKYDNVEEFFEALISLILNEELRLAMGNNLYVTISQNNSEEGVMKQYFHWLKSI